MLLNSSLKEMFRHKLKVDRRSFKFPLNALASEEGEHSKRRIPSETLGRATLTCVRTSVHIQRA